MSPSHLSQNAHVLLFFPATAIGELRSPRGLHEQAATHTPRPQNGRLANRVILVNRGVLNQEKVILPFVYTQRRSSLRETVTYSAINVRASKVDSFNVGTWGNHYKAHNLLCPVTALRDIPRVFPQRFQGGEEAGLPIFRRANGAPLWRSQVQVLIDTAAAQEGLPPKRFGTHSLRIGGATALFHAGVPVGIIKRWGRWVSDSFQRYLWDANEDAKGLSRKMAEDSGTLSNTH